MKRSSTALGAIALVIGTAILALLPEQVVTQTAGSFVALQGSAPGTAQNGSANLTGTVRATQFEGEGASLSGSGLQTLRSENASSSINAAGIYGLSNAAAGFTYGGRFDSSSTSGVGAFGWATAGSGTTYGIYGRTSSTDGLGVFGEADSPTGATIGVHGRSASPTGLGMFGYVSSPTGVTRGVLGQSNSKDGYGVYGLNVSSEFPAYAGYFQSLGQVGLYATAPWEAARFIATHNDGKGIVVHQTATGGNSVGGDFDIASPNGTALRGFAQNTGFGVTYGVGGSSNSAGGRGVDGYCDHATGQTYGVIGQVRSENGWALFAAGRFGATGTKSFRIDHPTEPLDKFLLHYSAEGPEPMNAYSGSIITDHKGYANVELPDYYAEINKEERIQLTVVDERDSESFVQAKVVGLVQNGAFRIRTSAPRTKVFWRLEAVRNDAWVRRYGAPVEQKKIGAERGKYQHPELYDAPEEMGMYSRPARRGESKQR